MTEAGGNISEHSDINQRALAHPEMIPFENRWLVVH